MAGNDQFAEMTRERRAVWESFTAWSFWIAVGIVILLVLLAIFVV